MYELQFFDIFGVGFTPSYSFESLEEAEKFAKKTLGSGLRKREVFDFELQVHRLEYTIRRGNGPNGLKKAVIIWEG